MHGTFRPMNMAELEMELRAARSELAEARAQAAAYRAALEFYADPETYFAVAFDFDPPTGGFDEDFDREHGNPHFERPMPGKRARDALSAPNPGEPLLAALREAREALEGAKRQMTNDWYNAPRLGMEAEHAAVTATLAKIKEVLGR